MINCYKYSNNKNENPLLLCECELYSSANYDSDPQIKSVIDNFNKQTQQRLHEYDERMKTTRQECKEQCDKEIQKIILKYKLEKELMDKFATLHTDMQSDAIPTCVCEKSIADKVEKECLKCAQNLGGIVAPSSGVLGEIAAFALKGWKSEAIAAATKYAMKEGASQGAAKGLAAGMRVTIGVLKKHGVGELCPELLESIGSTIHYTDSGQIAKIILQNLDKYCGLGSTPSDLSCMVIRTKLGMIVRGNAIVVSDDIYIPKMMEQIVYKAKLTADDVTKTISERVTDILTRQQTSEIAATYASWQTPIIASIVAIVVIILVMVIIYLVLRYRRKKKMKKKLQYIKLLKE
ncbi:PIR protein, putative [Plasmodium sp. gorilla clade G1]|nr:PIR protein, putative [Plasmodium sp.]SOS80835.1 PIR protein, putative [Plasmodium sp. gorilla clade G1]